MYIGTVPVGKTDMYLIPLRNGRHPRLFSMCCVQVASSCRDTLPREVHSRFVWYLLYTSVYSKKKKKKNPMYICTYIQYMYANGKYSRGK